MPYRAVLFDFDLTLVDSRPAFWECLNFAARELGWTPPVEDGIYKLMGRPLPVIMSLIYPAATPEEIAAYETSYQAHADEVMTGLTQFIPGVATALTALHGQGLKLGIVSQKLRYRLEEFLEREGMLDTFDVIIGPADAPAFKPDPRGLLMALDRLGVVPAESIYVGDTAIDGETARRAGAAFIGVLSGETEADKLAELGLLELCDSVADLPDVIAALNTGVAEESR